MCLRDLLAANAAQANENRTFALFSESRVAKPIETVICELRHK
jgi:hypothetical protein